ncbi:outer membrane protein [endosymbiont of Acanthamoeba sp. UWC8]|uniref:YhdP family protein n=1 Tax=endosymbiont of Acanthamoeba sp. UWC8 TaxID=86106 RepID=UPI0004D11C52|nr:AsmA-like C-terminal domain-containing protein [endosymbiont of Acanthamoeba sp. UWC8]AIF80779.1 outer membrane protein [endosymbiont of Acanthamoeba sp. UWC8]
MVIRAFKILSKIIFSLVALAAILLFSTYIWLATGSKSIPFAAKYVSNQATKLVPNAKFNIKELKAGLNKKDYSIYFDINNLNITLSNYDPFVLTNTKIKFHPAGLIPFTKQPLVNLELSLDKINFAPLKSGNQELTKDIPVDLIDNFILKNKKRLKRFNFILLNTSFTFIKNNNPITFKVEKASFSPVKSGNTLLLRAKVQAKINKENITINSLFNTSSKKELVISGVVKGISYKSLNELGFGTKILNNADIKLDLNFKAITTKFNTFDQLNFNINSTKGLINPNQDFTTPVIIDSLTILGKCLNSCSTIEFERLKILFQGNQILVSGKFTDNILSINTSTSKINLEQVLKLWPRTLSPKSYTWLSEYLKAAEIKGVSAHLHFNLEDLANGKDLKDDSLYVTFPIENAALQYPKDSPLISNIDGIIDIYPNKIDIKIKNGKILSSELKDFDININDLIGKNTMLDIKGKLIGSVQDSIDLAYIYSKKQNSEFKNLQGNIISELEILIPLIGEENNKNFNLSVASQISDLKTEVFNKYPISNGLLKVNLKDNILLINGTADFADNVPLIINHEEFLSPEDTNKYISKTKVELALTKDFINKQGHSIGNIIASNNKIPANLVITKDLNQATSAEIEINLKNNSLNISKIGVKKRIGDPGFLKLKLDNINGEYKIKDYKLSIPNLTSEGTIETDQDFNIASVNSNKTIVKGSSFGFTYKNSIKSDYLLLRGNEVNLSTLDFSKLSETSNTKRDKPFIFESKIRRLVLKNGVIINSPAFNAKCTQSSCNFFSLNGSLGNNETIEASLNYPILNIQTSNAGKIIAAFGISSNIEHGSLKLTGTYSQKDTLTGSLNITDFNLKNAPIFTKLLSISSLTTASGIINIMQGKGVSFDKLSCPFTFKSGIITINNCVQKGAVLTIVTEGTIDLNKKYIDISGTLVPANIINSIVDNIPLIGSTISGGKNSGIIGTKFALKGSLEGEGPSPSVNPLSILTPGFLRNIF